jgi:2-phospho-L-lactate guanylyltransferase
VLAIVPVKSLESAKTRLTPALGPVEREQFVMQMLDAVLDACAAATRISDTLVVTPDPAMGRGRPVLRDDGSGQGPAIAAALRDPRAKDGVVVVMADCALVTPASLDALAQAAAPLALVASADGGTSALALADPSLVEPAFGIPDSASVTIERARAAGIEPAVVRDPALAFDVDSPADLARLALHFAA